MYTDKSACKARQNYPTAPECVVNGTNAMTVECEQFIYLFIYRVRHTDVLSYKMQSYIEFVFVLSVKRKNSWKIYLDR